MPELERKMTTALSPGETYSSDERYQYDTFTTGLILEDLVFRASDPEPGDAVPAFDLPVVHGGRFRSADLGGKPVLMIFGSLTCPVTESSGSVLKRLHQTYGAHIRFVMVNTREAHPGTAIPQPKTFAEKEQHARQLTDHHQFPFEVAVDDLEGSLHRALGPKPNSAYLLGPDGVILFRAHWANDAGGLRQAISDVLRRDKPRRTKSSAMLWPLLKAIGFLPGIVSRGGAKISHDVWRAVPPFGVVAALSRLFPFLPRDYRGVAAAMLLLAAGTVATVLVSFAI